VIKAVALKQWLENNGWSDVFLAIDPREGIVPGEIWKTRIIEEISLCVAVVFLLSDDWSRSKWCSFELETTIDFGKLRFGVKIAKHSEIEIPASLVGKHQLANIAEGEDHSRFIAVFPDNTRQVTTFSSNGLERLKIGLRRAGLDPNSFVSPPSGQQDRSPYPGIQVFEVDDAAIFFGRDASVVEILEATRRLRDKGTSTLIPILAPSGSGKSSFLRAGILARLLRDETRFRVLPIIRPRGEAINGTHGLRPSVLHYWQRWDTEYTANSAEQVFSSGATAIVDKIALLNSAAIDSPTVILAIDQAEELFRQDSSNENEQLLKVIQKLLTHREMHVIVYATISASAFGQLQTSDWMSGVFFDPFSLPTFPTGMYSLVIEGPAQVSRDPDRRLVVDPRLTLKLLDDLKTSNSKDGLPLLAMTLDRIYAMGRESRRLSLDLYLQSGGLSQVIEATVASALNDCGYSIDDGRAWLKVKDAIIPHLIEIDTNSGIVNRRVASVDEIPASSQRIVRKLVGTHLFTTDTPLENDPSSGPGVTTVEIAHEALLRQWPRLINWIEANHRELRAINDLTRDTDVWLRNNRPTERLVHRGARIQEIKNLIKTEWKSRFRNIDIAYLEECVRLESKEKRGRFLRISSLCFGVVFLLTSWIYYYSNVLENNRNLRIGLAKTALSASQSLFDSGRMEEGGLVAISAADVLKVDDSSFELRASLKRYVDFAKNSQTVNDVDGEVFEIHAPGLLFEDKLTGILSFYNGGPLPAWKFVQKNKSPIVSARVSSSKEFLFLAKQDGTLETRRIADGGVLSSKRPLDKTLTSDDVTLSGDGYAVLSYQANGKSYFQVFDLKQPISSRKVLGTIDGFFDGEKSNDVISSGDSHYTIIRKKNMIDVKDVKLSKSDQKRREIADCFVRMMHKVPQNIDNIEYGNLDLLSSECFSSDNISIVSQNSWNSAGGLREDKIYYDVGNASDVDLRQTIFSTFGVSLDGINATWMDLAKDGLIAAIYKRELFVVRNFEPLLHVQQNGGPLWAALTTDGVVSVWDPGLRVIRNYKIDEESLSSESGDALTADPSKSHEFKIKPKYFDNCFGAIPSLANFQFHASNRHIIEIIPFKADVSSEEDPEIDVKIKVDNIEMRFPEATAEDSGLCFQAIEGQPFLLVHGLDNDAFRVYDLSRTNEKSNDYKIPFDIIATPTSSFSISSDGTILTTNYQHEVYRWHRQTTGGWARETKPFFTSNNEIQFAQLNFSRQALLVTEDTGQRRIIASVYLMGDIPRLFAALGREYKFLNAHFLDNENIHVEYNGSSKEFYLPHTSELLEQARKLLPRYCQPNKGSVPVACWPVEIAHF
jgi:hypothetical protein